MFAVWVLTAPAPAQEARPDVRVEKDRTYGKAGDTEWKLDLVMPKGGRRWRYDVNN